MAPGLLSDEHNGAELTHNVKDLESDTKSRNTAPLQLSGALDKFAYEEATPVIGREYPTVNIVDDLLNGENADELLRDMAITIAQRGVVFFRAQNNLTNALQKQFVHRMGQLAGKPASSSLHIHPILNSTSEFNVAGDDQISEISSVERKRLFAKRKNEHNTALASAFGSGSRRYDSARWHSDIQFERVPADYTSLRLTQLPKCGGDTLWASGYDLYDRFSPAYRAFLEGLTATFSGDGFLKAADANPDKVKIYTAPRGNPVNQDRTLTAVHPVVRTNPVTGWKSIFTVGPFPKQINQLNAQESEELLKKFEEMIERNHDLQVRFRWRNENDIAIWDNRSAFHSATFDYEGLGERFGQRAVGIGEAPYLDPNSKSRSEALGLVYDD